MPAPVRMRPPPPTTPAKTEIMRRRYTRALAAAERVAADAAVQVIECAKAGDSGLICQARMCLALALVNIARATSRLDPCTSELLDWSPAKTETNRPVPSLPPQSWWLGVGVGVCWVGGGGVGVWLGECVCL